MRFILFAVCVAWLYATWPFRLLWLKWQGYRAHRDIMRALSSLHSRAYYHEDE